MDKFIKVHDLYTDDLILINIDSIDVLLKASRQLMGVNECTKIVIGNNAFTVVETIDEIVKRMIESKR